MRKIAFIFALFLAAGLALAHSPPICYDAPCEYPARPMPPDWLPALFTLAGVIIGLAAIFLLHFAITHFNLTGSGGQSFLHSLIAGIAGIIVHFISFAAGVALIFISNSLLDALFPSRGYIWGPSLLFLSFAASLLTVLLGLATTNYLLGRLFGLEKGAAGKFAIRQALFANPYAYYLIIGPLLLLVAIFSQLLFQHGGRID